MPDTSSVTSSVPDRPGAAIDVVPEGANAVAVFRSGQTLIERNSGDSLGASRRELEEGVRRVERALKRGYGNEKQAQEALAHAYSALASRVGAPEKEVLLFLEKERQAYERLAQLEPGVPEWLMQSVAATPDRAAQVPALQDLVRKHPNYVPARKLLAERLCASGRSKEGMEHVTAAANRLARDSVESIGSELVGIAWRCEREPGAERVRRILGTKGRARSGPGSGKE